MKRLIITSIAALTMGVMNAAEQGENRPKLTPEQREMKRAQAKARMIKSTGGFVMRPSTQKGEIVFVNCQKAASDKCINDSALYFSNQSRFKISVKNGTFDLSNVQVQGNFSIFIIDDAKQLPLLVAPENRWAMVNVAPLKVGNGEKPQFLEARTRKEINRAFSYLCGGVLSQYPGSVLSNVTKTEDLDNIPEMRLPLDMFQRFTTYMEFFGVTPAQQVTYRRACQEGWAPMPTNEYQKAIWDKVHEIPKNPMKIEFDPKKGR